MTLPLDGKRALVTGAASGIGRATALELGRRGADVVLVDVSSCDAIAAEITMLGRKSIAVEADVGDEAQASAATRRTITDLGGLDILVNCAGIMRETRLLEMSMEEFDEIVRVNLRGAFLMGREAIGAMKRQGSGGRVVNIASELAYLGRAEYSAYCATKAAVLGLTRSWAREFAPDILVNSVAPGPVDTPMLGIDNMTAEWRKKETDIPLGRIGTPEEIAGVIAFLAGPEATFVTGQTFSPNGGAVML
ncbi:MAG: SDR family oxidoreductase [Alphaproteobacteria bacterium]|nr:SDR family oxidoreductase [Alphaproteobacteria bacterium]